MWWTLNSSEYHPLQTGYVTGIKIKNNTENEMLVTSVGIYFEWMDEDKWWFKNCNIKVEPKDVANIPDVPFRIALNASIGTQLYKPGVSSKLLIENKWSGQGTELVEGGEHIIISKPPKRNFEVFISHSNCEADIGLLDLATESFDKCGIKTYVAERKPQPGYPLWQKIEAAIRRADVILVLGTKVGLKSGEVREEIGISIGAGKIGRIIPLVQTRQQKPGSLLGLEDIPLDVDKANEAISTAIIKSIEWADEKEAVFPQTTST